VRNLAVDNQVVLTNQVPSGLNRGFGGPQFFYPLERLMDRAARALGIDPAELRRRNLVRAEEFPYQSPAGSLLDSGDYRGCLALAMRQIGYETLRAEQEAARRDGRMFGLGVACAVETSASNMAYVNLALSHDQRSRSLPKSGASGYARVTMDPLGSVIVHIDSLPNGQGHNTVVAQITADELGVKPQDIAVVSDLDTMHGPWSITSGNYSNRFSAVVSSAVALAARKGATKLRAVAARMLEVEPDAVELANGMASAPGARNEPIPIRRLAAQLHWDSSNPPNGVDGAIAETVRHQTHEGEEPDLRNRDRQMTAACDGEDGGDEQRVPGRPDRFGNEGCAAGIPGEGPTGAQAFGKHSVAALIGPRDCPVRTLIPDVQRAMKDREGHDHEPRVRAPIHACSS
jgi:2-furoyl-CoA dehydrogenase large subunit